MGQLKAFEVEFDGNKTVYYPGQEVRGKLVVDLKGEMKIKALRISMRGVAKVHWIDSDDTWIDEYNGEIEYFFKKQTLFGSETSAALTEGHHEFPFSFQLPASEISTSFEGKYGSIRYWLKAEMEKPLSVNKETKKAFSVISPIDINRAEYLMPVENSMEKNMSCWCWTSGLITLFARTDRKGYCPGESIAIRADFGNHSSCTVIPQATLQQTQKFLADGKSRKRRGKFTTVTGDTIQPGRTANWDAQLLRIPDVSPSITNCSIIKVDYAVRITLQIPRAYDLSVDLPIVIGTVPLQTRPPHDDPHMSAASVLAEDPSAPSEDTFVHPPASP